MALQVWLPLNGNLNNQGLSNVTVTNNGATVDNNGKIGKCYKFNPDNSSSGQNYLLLNSNLSDILPTSGKSFSFACWVKLTGDLYSNGCGLIAANQYTATGVGVYIKSTKKIHIQMCYNGTEQEWTANGMTAFQNNVWYHITYTYNETGRQMTVYINGVNVDSTTANNIWVTRNEKISIGRGSQGGWNYTLPGFMNDVRIYDHCLSPKEVYEIAKGLVLHYKLDGNDISDSMESTLNLANYSTNYSNVTYGLEYTASGWGGDAGTITYYGSGGYNNGPYKVYHKTATGTGGIHKKLDQDIHIEGGKTYTMSVYVKASRNFSDSAHSFCINRNEATQYSGGNRYITFGNTVHYTTEWQRISKTFIATDADTGEYGEMSIIYNDDVTDYYVYFSCFQIEENDHATAYVDGSRNLEPTTNLLNYSNLQGHGSSWTLQSTTFHGNEIYKNVVTSPSRSNNAGFSIRSQITNSALSTATKITLSFYKKLNTVYGKNLGGYLRVIKSDDTEAVYSWTYNKSNWANDENSIGIWQYITSTVTIPTGCKAIKHCYVYTDNATSGDCDFSCIQLELKDHATPYVNGTRTSSNNVIMYDSSGYCNHGAITGTLITNNDSSRYECSTKFPDNACSIGIGNLKTLVPEGIFTFNIWFKKVTGEWSTKVWETILGGPSGFELEGKLSSTQKAYIHPYSWGGGSTTTPNSYSIAYELDKWNMLTMVRTTSNTKFYLNGELKVTGTIGSVPSGDYFIGAWRTAIQQNYRGFLSDARIYTTALSDEDILELYNTSAFVTDNGVFAEYELYEDNLSDVKKTGLLETGDFYENGADENYTLDTDKTRVASNYIISEDFIEI